jgi:Secretion system C-terminal sorting domain
MLPHRNIWGFSNDDMHYCPNDCFKSYNIMLMNVLSLQNFRSAIDNGAFFFAYEEYGDGNSLLPIIDSIIVDELNKSIRIHANNYTEIQWISGIEGSDSLRKSNIIDSTAVFYYDSLTTPYVRAQIINQYGKLYTQPFSFCTEYVDNLHDTLCDGDSLLLHGNTYNHSGIFYDTLQSIYHCDSILKLELFVYPLTNVQFSGLDSFYCVYHAADSLFGNPEGGIFSGQGVISNVFNPSIAGIGSWEIEYLYTDSNSCSNSTKKTVVIDECIGTNDNEIQKSKIYPIPSSGKLYIEINDKTQVSIFNFLGSLVYKNRLEKSKTLLNLSHLHNGIYFIQLESAIQTEKQIIILQN